MRYLKPAVLLLLMLACLMVASAAFGAPAPRAAQSPVDTVSSATADGCPPGPRPTAY